MEKHLKRGFMVLMAFALMLMPIVGTNADQRTTTVDGSTMHRTYAISTTTATTRRHGKEVQTIVHKQGAESKRCVDGTYYFSASGSLASPQYSNVFQNHCSSMGLVSGKQISSSGIWCKIPKTVADGTYKVYIVWSAVKLNQVVKTTYSGGQSISLDRTVAYVPCSTSRVISAPHGR